MVGWVGWAVKVQHLREKIWKKIFEVEHKFVHTTNGNRHVVRTHTTAKSSTRCPPITMCYECVKRRDKSILESILFHVILIILCRSS